MPRAKVRATSKSTGPKMRYFRVLHGRHCCNDKRYYKDSPDGNIIPTTSDLVKLFNSTGSTKFVELDEVSAKRVLDRRQRFADGSIAKREPKEEQVEEVTPEPVENPIALKLNEMSEADLRQMASDEEVDLEGCESKEDIVAVMVESAS